MKRFHVYQALVIAIGVAGFYAAWTTSSAVDARTLAFFIVMSALSAWFSQDIQDFGSFSLSLAVNFAAVLVAGPLVGGITAAAGGVSREDFELRKPPLTIVFNLAQLGLSAIFAGYVAQLVGLQPMALTGFPTLTVGLVLQAGAAALALLVANIVFVTPAISLRHGIPWWEVVKMIFAGQGISLAVQVLLGLLVACLVANVGWWATVLVIVPFALAVGSLGAYINVTEVYEDTVRSLVNAIETKDPYTRGHSERVAWYTRQIAEEVRLPKSRADRLVWAALLHDVGKVAVPARTLTKPSKLEDAEWESIRRHPSTAVEILGEIDYLADLLPSIASHHERPDGRGYPKGLSGTEIPEGARILAVADCFDAMTSGRAYRPGMEYELARAELYAVSGLQLDPEFVDALMERVDADTLRKLVAQGEVRP
jgi:putative nucleotidyltransferase with HDIG domain